MDTKQSMGIKDDKAQERQSASSLKAAPTSGGVAASGASHTPTPWRLIPVTADDEYPTPNIGDHRLAGADDVSPGIIFGGYPTLAGVDGNAAFIVRAVNSHAELVEALRNLLSACEGTTVAEWEEYAQARAALLKASPDKSMEQV